MTISTADLETATKGRLAADDPETARLLEVGLGVARLYCGWHVTPAKDHDVAVIDGDVRGGGPSLRLPTLLLIEPYSVTEDGVDLDVAALDWSTDGRIRKQDGTYWTQRIAGITVDMNHGFDSAPGFEAAVINYAARTSLSTADGGRQRTVVGPFRYAVHVATGGSAFIAEERAMLDYYRLEPYP